MSSLIIENPNQFRENIRKKMFDHIQMNSDAATNLEKGVFNYAIQEATFRKIVKMWDNASFVQLYLDRLRTVYINLKNPDLLASLQSGEIAPQTLAFMTHQEFNPEKWKDLLDQKMKRDIAKYDKKIEASTDMFTCKKCHSKKCTYYELQTRSADEPATIFVTCLDCGKHWKM
jgi:transcription elongation factor S-II